MFATTAGRAPEQAEQAAKHVCTGLHKHHADCTPQFLAHMRDVLLDTLH